MKISSKVNIKGARRGYVVPVFRQSDLQLTWPLILGSMSPQFRRDTSKLALTLTLFELCSRWNFSIGISWGWAILVKNAMFADEEESTRIQNPTVITNVQSVKLERDRRLHHICQKTFPVPLPLEPAKMSRVGLV